MKNGRSFKMENVHRNGFSGTLKVIDSLPDPQVLPKPARRKLTPEYKLRILHESEACHDRGAIGALHVETVRLLLAQGAARMEGIMVSCHCSMGFDLTISRSCIPCWSIVRM